jgi:hypothetical protein
MQRVLRERWEGGGEEGIGSLRDDGYGRDDGLYLRGERRETKDAEGEFVWVGRIREKERERDGEIGDSALGALLGRPNSREPEA